MALTVTVVSGNLLLSGSAFPSQWMIVTMTAASDINHPARVQDMTIGVDYDASGNFLNVYRPCPFPTGAGLCTVAVSGANQVSATVTL